MEQEPCKVAAFGSVKLLNFMICHSKSAIDPAPQDVIKTMRWNNIWDAPGMHKM
jgi:hypothetical protein